MEFWIIVIECVMTNEKNLYHIFIMTLQRFITRSYCKYLRDPITANEYVDFKIINNARGVWLVSEQKIGQIRQG